MIFPFAEMDRPGELERPGRAGEKELHGALESYGIKFE